VKNRRATYEIPYASIQRPTTRNNTWEQARYEVSAHYWADLTEADGSYGVSLLNDSKYGHDVEGNVLRLTLLRSPTSPDPVADRGKHTLAYALYPHRGDWREGDTVRRGHEFNTPLLVRFVGTHKGKLPRTQSFFSVDADNVVLNAIKKAEDSNALILRLYEAEGRAVTARVTLPFTPKKAYWTDLLEQDKGSVRFSGKTLEVLMGKNEVKTIRVEF